LSLLPILLVLGAGSAVDRPIVEQAVRGSGYEVVVVELTLVVGCVGTGRPSSGTRAAYDT
jgi:hypothetical protein